jgi:hypothetical protein
MRYSVMGQKNIMILFCHFPERLGNDEDDQLAVVCDLESILTFYCKSRSIAYVQDNGWLEILQPMLALKQSRSELYSIFYALVTKYVSK